MQDALDKFYESFIPVRLLGENDFVSVIYLYY